MFVDFIFFKKIKIFNNKNKEDNQQKEKILAKLL
jgi:hypothetical protein